MPQDSKSNYLPKISIILPIYKVEKYLRRCLDSLLVQTFGDIEVILVDDGSPDGCPEICDEYASIYPNFKVIHKSNGGVSSARNCGLKYAIGTYVVFCDPDDFYNPDSMENFIRYASIYTNECQLFVGEGYNIVDEYGNMVPTPISYNDQILNVDTAIVVMENNKIAGVPWNKLFLNSLIKKYNLTFNVDYAAHEDKLFVLQYLEHVDKVCIFPNHIYNYYQRSDSLTTDFKNLRMRINALNECLNLSSNIFKTKAAYICQQRWCGAWLKVYLHKCYSIKSLKLYSIRDRLLVLKQFVILVLKYMYNLL